MSLRILFILLCLGTSHAVVAEESNEDIIRAGLSKLLKGVQADSITETQISGLYEVVVGPRLFYISGDGRYLVQGELYDVTTKTNLTEPKVAKAKLKAIEDLGEENMVIFAPEKYEHTVTVFTDIDCGYCRKLHKQMDAYNDKGIRIRYLFFPRAGVGSESYKKAVSVWCADDRNKALTDAKNGRPVAAKECENPVKQELMLGQLLGVNGTPALFLGDGELLPGYIPPARLAEYLKKK